MATAPPLLSIEEYLHTSYKPDVHFVDGEIEERNVGEHTHNIIQGFFYFTFTANEAAWKMEAIIEQRIRIGSNQVRVADIAVLPADAPFQEVLTVPPLLCVEIMSPEDRYYRSERVLEDYLALGVPNIWLIDPMHRSAFVYDASGLHPADPSKLCIENSSVCLDLTAPFAKLDRIAAAANRL
jgi:Uma2 family endonuclease